MNSLDEDLSDSQKVTPELKYIIIDFSCTKYYSHNWAYLSEFGNFIIKNFPNSSIEYMINRAADPRILLSTQNSIIPTLLSPIYGYSKSSNFFRWLVDRAFSFGFSALRQSTLFARLSPKLLSLATLYYTQSAMRVMRSKVQGSEEVVLVFPSIDGLGLHFIERCLSNGLAIKGIVIRTLQAETRGIYSVNNLVGFVENLCDKYPEVDIRIGFEVLRVGEKLRLQARKGTKILWSPIPHTKVLLERDVSAPDGVLKIGFLGAARRLKGFEIIPQIIRAVNSSSVAASFYIQLAAEKWEGYEETLEEIQNCGASIFYLEGGCSEDILLETISRLDALVLPYMVDEYRYAGSGLLFHAADFGVPTISIHGVGFDWDIEQYGIGILCKNYSEIPNKFLNLSRQDFQDSIDNYNSDRNLVSATLLDFKRFTS